MLKNRQVPIPNQNSNLFYCPVLKWHAPPNTSFRAQCEQYALAIRGNGALARQAGLPTTMTEIENHVDRYYSEICRRNGWTQYLADGGATAQTPFPQPARSPQSKQTIRQSLKNVAVGGKVLVEWIASGAEAVAPELANHRAAICSSCPCNEQGDWSRWFTVPVAAAIRKALDMRAAWKLSTPSDDRLMTCAACLCPMKLKVHVPLDRFYNKMTDQAKNDLDKGCWIRSETAAKILNAVDEGLKKQ